MEKIIKIVKIGMCAECPHHGEVTDYGDYISNSIGVWLHKCYHRDHYGETLVKFGEEHFPSWCPLETFPSKMSNVEDVNGG